MHFASRRKQPHIEPVAASRPCAAAAAQPKSVARAAALLACFALLAAGPAAAQKQKDKQQDANSAGIVSPIPPPDSQAIDTVVSQMLAAWQLGDVDMMHKYYADDVTVISGTWEAPLLGWTNYAHAFQSQRARTKADRLERTNSYTKVTGETAWCTYQWRYTGEVDGTPATAFGHTTLMLEKRAGNWLIVLNHTSVVPVSAPSSSTAAPQVPQAVGRVSGPGA